MAKKIGKLTIYFLLICIGYIYLEPLIKMVSMAIMSSDDIIDPAVEWIATKPTFDNFKIAATVLKVKKSMITSLVFSVSIAALQTIVSAMTGYALSRFKFVGKKFWFTMILFTFIMPVTVLMIPRLMIFVRHSVTWYSNSTGVIGGFGTGNQRNYPDFDFLELF